MQQTSNFEAGWLQQQYCTSIYIYHFRTTVFPSSDAYFQQDNVPCQKAHIISKRFLE